jgi:hypothetical protein
VKIVLCLAVLVTSTAWADETIERASIEATVAALNASPFPPNLFTGDFANADELQRFLGQAGPVIEPSLPTDGVVVRTDAATLVISREPMGEATLHLPPANAIPLKRFVTRSVTFISPDTSVVVAIYERQFEPIASRRVPILFVLRHEGSDWRIASFRVLVEAGPKNVP